MALKNFDGSNLDEWVTQMEYYLYLHGIIDDMIKRKVGVLYLDLEWWQWWEWHTKLYTNYLS